MNAHKCTDSDIYGNCVLLCALRNDCLRHPLKIHEISECDEGFVPSSNNVSSDIKIYDIKYQ